MIDNEVHSRSPHADALFDLLRSRRSVFDFLPDPVPDVLLERAIDAGRFAPNHKLTEPWRFTIIGPEAKQDIAAAWSEVKQRKLPAEASEERRDQARTAAREKWMSKPAVVAVSQALDDDPARREEDYAAIACAIQNIQLAAWALGLGCQWSTTAATRDPEVMRRASIPKSERVVGFLFLGYAAAVPEAQRKPLEEVLRRTP